MIDALRHVKCLRRRNDLAGVRDCGIGKYGCRLSEGLINYTAAASMRRSQPRTKAFEVDCDRPFVAFSPDGSMLENIGYCVPLKLGEGVLPLTVLMNSLPVLAGLHSGNRALEMDASGFTCIAVVNAKGNAVTFEVHPML